ncbi:hypothetical protein GIB67_038351 [Kingdonia uniflora]|uniref:Protein kinase domain-containing protein n=1 Tax=Kingdonia uniflora TaxID=39325 RepID=A0A7J7KUM5_9MAGN|nr:hypothetical protein GIB67_038351 [Kingdonia uniflora]
MYVFPAFLAIIVVVLATIVAFFPDAFGIPRETIDFYGKYNNQMKVVLVLVTSFAALFYFSDGISKAFIFLYKFIITGVLFILYVFPAFLAIIVVVLATIVAFFPNAFGIPREIIDFYGKYNNQMKVALVLVTSFAALFYFSDGISKAFIFLYKFIITGVLFILYVFPAFLAIIVVVLATIVAFFPDAFGIPRETIDFYRKYSNQMKVALVLITSSAALFYFYHGLIDELSMIFLFILYLLIAFLHQKYNNKSKVARLIEEIPHKDLDKLGKVDDGTLIAVESIEGQKHGKQESFKVDVQQVPKAKKSSGVMVAASMVDGLKAIEAGLVRKFHYEELKTATTKFSDRLGKGGSGQVFKGILMDGESVAVKRVEREVYGEKEFLSELSATASTQHFNLILHLDIKPENILVGDDFRGVLSDFGMSKLMGKDESRFHTEMTRGTRDYMAPEWNSGHGMEKSVDIFSYGKVLMDMFLGQRCVCFNQKGEDIYVRGGNTPLEQRKALIYVKKKIVKKEILDLIDKRLMGDGGVDERSASLFVNVAIQCLKEDPRKRPRDMWVVFKMLEPILNDPDDKKEDDEDEDDDDEEEND